MKKTLFISLRSDLGGGPQHLYDLLSRFATSEPIYIASPLDEPFGPKFQRMADAHFELGHRTFSLATFLRLLRFVKQHNIAIVHSHGRGAGLYSRLLKLAGLKVVHTFHGVHLESRLKLALDRILKPLTDRFILVSDAEMSEALLHHVAIKKKCVIINNGIDIPCLQSRLEGLPEHNNAVFTVGALNRFNYQKGIDLMLDAIAYFCEYNPDTKIRFIVAGDGELMSEMREKKTCLKLDGVVEFVGATEDPMGFLHSLDLFISFARWEAAIPYTVMEAMCAARPILISNVVGHNELEICKDIALFEPANAEDFAKKLLLLYSQKPLREQMSEELKQYVIENFNADITAKKTQELLQSL